MPWACLTNLESCGPCMLVMAVSCQSPTGGQRNARHRWPIVKAESPGALVSACELRALLAHPLFATFSAAHAGKEPVVTNDMSVLTRPFFFVAIQLNSSGANGNQATPQESEIPPKAREFAKAAEQFVGIVKSFQQKIETRPEVAHMREDLLTILQRIVVRIFKSTLFFGGAPFSLLSAGMPLTTCAWFPTPANHFFLFWRARRSILFSDVDVTWASGANVPPCGSASLRRQTSLHFPRRALTLSLSVPGLP